MSWSYPNGSPMLFLMIATTLVVGFGIMACFMYAPSQWRKPVVAACTFVAGAIYVAYYLWPTPSHKGPPQSTTDWVAAQLSSGVAVVAGDASQALTTFLLGLGIYSLVRIHGKRLFGMQKDWAFSLVLLVSMALMVFFGYMNYWQTKFSADAANLQDYSHWGFVNYTNDFLFDGMYQQMDAAMFSIISFYILSAAYRAFRVRSIESTILLASALIMILSLMGIVEGAWTGAVHSLGLSDNFTITEIAKWISATVQNSSIRALDFGVGLGALAMGLRLWLSLEKGVGA